MPFPTYSLAVDFPQGDVDLSRLFEELIAAGPYTTTLGGLNHADDVVTVDFSTAPSTANQTTVDAVISAHSMPTALDKARTAKAISIDSRTQQIIGLGFEYPPSSGVMFSLSANSQRSLLAADSARNDPAFTYPVRWNSIDDLTVQSMADSASVHGFFLTAIGTVREILDSGTALKDTARAATTLVDVDAVVDNR